MHTITPASVVDDDTIRERLIGHDKRALPEVYERHSGIVLRDRAVRRRGGLV